MRPRLIVFTRYPTPGRVKTRLIPALGAEGAARLHRTLTARTIATAQRLVARGEVSLEVCVAGGQLATMASTFGRELKYRTQGPGDLGDRMRRAIGRALAEGAPAVIVVGSDVPGLRVGILRTAIRALRRVDVVFGPARDGGYYLIGMREQRARLFAGVPWGTGRVLARSLSLARRSGLSVALLDPLSDVDRPRDLRAILPMR